MGIGNLGARGVEIIGGVAREDPYQEGDACVKT